MKFKSGDRVRYVGDSSEHYGSCGYLSKSKGWKCGHWTWALEFNEVWLGEMDVSESELELVYSKPSKYSRCECGAHAQKGFENIHSEWCPMYEGKK